MGKYPKFVTSNTYVFLAALLDKPTQSLHYALDNKE